MRPLWKCAFTTYQIIDKNTNITKDYNPEKNPTIPFQYDQKRSERGGFKPHLIIIYLTNEFVSWCKAVKTKLDSGILLMLNGPIIRHLLRRILRCVRKRVDKNR